MSYQESLHNSTISSINHINHISLTIHPILPRKIPNKHKIFLCVQKLRLFQQKERKIENFDEFTHSSEYYVNGVKGVNVIATAIVQYPGQTKHEVEFNHIFHSSFSDYARDIYVLVLFS